MGLRFGDIYELVAFNAMYRSRFPTRGEHTIFAPGSTYEVKLGDDPTPIWQCRLLFGIKIRSLGWSPLSVVVDFI